MQLKPEMFHNLGASLSIKLQKLMETLVEFRRPQNIPAASEQKQRCSIYINNSGRLFFLKKEKSKQTGKVSESLQNRRELKLIWVG